MDVEPVNIGEKVGIGIDLSFGATPVVLEPHDARRAKDLFAGRYYVNVHTTKNPAGEIRGQITKAITHA